MKFSTKSRYALRLMAELARYAPGDGNTVFTKQLIVTVDQLCLPHRREKLPLLHTI